MECSGVESASCSLAGACALAISHPRDGAGGLCLPAVGRRQAQVLACSWRRS